MPFSIRNMIITTILFNLIGCAQVTYFAKQGVGQLKLITGGTKNETLLNDPSINPSIKIKIRSIQKYTQFFYAYFNKPITNIYTSTILLDRPAVSYLLVTSPYDNIQPSLSCFPILGCFPYLGFYDLSDAVKAAQASDKIGLTSYIPPVYAYSSMGLFDDRILSSFFYYNQHELAEVIFHELFHTVFFIKNEVGLNEQLATFFAKKLTRIYYKTHPIRNYTQLLMEQHKKALLAVELPKSIRLINEQLANKAQTVKRRLTPKEAKNIIAHLLKHHTTPILKRQCHLLFKNKQPCLYDFSTWNTAQLAAFSTYFSDRNNFQLLMHQHKLSLRAFLNYIEHQYSRYTEHYQDISFRAYLFNHSNNTNTWQTK